jgi:hypothetical protein
MRTLEKIVVKLTLFGISIKDWCRRFIAYFVLLRWILIPKNNKDEFHPVFNQNVFLLFYLPDKLSYWYQRKLTEARKIAHERDLVMNIH